MDTLDSIDSQCRQPNLQCHFSTFEANLLNLEEVDDSVSRSVAVALPSISDGQQDPAGCLPESFPVTLANPN